MKQCHSFFSQIFFSNLYQKKHGSNEIIFFTNIQTRGGAHLFSSMTVRCGPRGTLPGTCLSLRGSGCRASFGTSPNTPFLPQPKQLSGDPGLSWGRGHPTGGAHAVYPIPSTESWGWGSRGWTKGCWLTTS